MVALKTLQGATRSPLIGGNQDYIISQVDGQMRHVYCALSHCVGGLWHGSGVTLVVKVLLSESVGGLLRLAISAYEYH